MTQPLPTSDTQPKIATSIAKILSPIVGGELPVHLTAWDGSEAGPADAPRVRLNSPNVLRRLLWAPGELGAAQAYVTGEISLETDLTETLQHVWRVVRERELSGINLTPALLLQLTKLAASNGVIGKPLPAPASQAQLRGRLHTLLRDRAAISHHYDLSNEFYALLLDENMAYSCGYWYADDISHEEAQRAKLDLVCRKIGLKPGDRFLDVGCGWGSLSLFAAAEYGAHVTGVTLSKEQKAFIDARIKERGLEDRVEIRLQDYREVPDGPYDAIASLEMGEHVGQNNYPAYTKALHDLLKPGGRVLIQQMSRRGKHPGGGPFIESFIAPDMHMRPVGETVALIEDSGLEVRDVEAMREHYVKTIKAWHDTFESNWETVVGLVGEEVALVWRLYLVGGMLTFLEGRMGVDQILSVRRTGAEPTSMPATRDWLALRSDTKN